MPIDLTDNTTDSELLELIQHDDRIAFERIYNRYWSKLYISAYKILRDRQGSEDIVQEVLVKLWLKRNALHIGSLNAYLHSAIRYQVFKVIRNGKVRERFFLEVEILLIDNDAESNLLTSDFNRKLEEYMADLPEKCRQVFYLSRKEYLSTKEIAEKLRISPKTVENQLTIALKKLRRLICELLFCTSIFLVEIWKK